MNLEQINPGDIVYAATEIRNDGGIPEVPKDALLATPNTRGVVVNIGHLEDNPERELFLVRFEDADFNLGPPIGCWPEELSAGPREGVR